MAKDEHRCTAIDDEGCPSCPPEERGWLVREIRAAKREVKRWPKWMRDLQLFEERK